MSAPDGTSAYRWPAGERLTRDFATVIGCRDLSVCDLGCGAGALGRAALAAGAARVTFADGDPAALAALRASLGAEGPIDTRARLEAHRWGEPLPGAPYDLILGGDILYRPECFADLLASIASGLAADGVGLLSDPRTRLDEELPTLAAACGLAWMPRRMTDYTLVRVTRGGG